MTGQTLLGFDYGESKVGVAVGNTVAGSASALSIIRYRSRAELFGAIEPLITEWSPQKLIVGRPLTETGEPSPVTGLAERFARRLEGRFGLPVAMIDARYTSLEAHAAIAADRADKRHNLNQFRPDHPRDDDAVAAAIILRQYLNEHSTP